MRTLALAFAVMLLLPLVTSPRPAAQWVRKTTAQLIQEYLGGKIPESQAQEIREDLSRRARGEMFEPIKKALGVEDTRGKAIKLAGSLSVPKLWEWVKSHYQTEALRADVIVVGLAGRDTAAADFIFERWKAADMKESEFTDLQAALCEHSLDMRVLDKFVKLIKDKAFDAERKNSAAAIVAAQASSGAVDIDSALKAFDVLKKKHGEHSKPARLGGANVLAENDIFVHGKVRACANSWWISGDGRVGLCAIPEKWQSGTYQLTIHVKPVGETGMFSVEIFSDEDDWSIVGNIGTGKWSTDNRADPDLMEPPLLKNAWNKVMLQIMPEGGSVKKNDRMMKIEVNGKLMTDWASLQGQINLLAISSAGAEVVIGGVETNKK